MTVASRIQESEHQALKEIRLLLYKAQSEVIDQNTDLFTLLEERLNMVERRVGVRAEITGKEKVPDDWVATSIENLYWIIMEALNNSLKHSKATRLKINFDQAETYQSVEDADNGVGCEPKALRPGGFGMRTMRERAQIIGGELTVKSAPGEGTQVCFKIKMEN